MPSNKLLKLPEITSEELAHLVDGLVLLVQSKIAALANSEHKQDKVFLCSKEAREINKIEYLKYKLIQAQTAYELLVKQEDLSKEAEVKGFILSQFDDFESLAGLEEYLSKTRMTARQLLEELESLSSTAERKKVLVDFYGDNSCPGVKK